jgi:predicted permease
MRAMRRWLVRLFASFAGRDEKRVREEVDEHLALQTTENIRRGMSPREARRQAVLKFGPVEGLKEHYREQQHLPFIDELSQDIRYGLRSLRKNPGFTTVAVLTLALGVGANTAIFSVIQALLLRPLPVPYSGQLKQLFLVRQDQTPSNAFSYPFVQALAGHREIFDGLFGFVATTFAVGGSGAVEQVDGAWVTGEYYETLGLVPVVGRLLTPYDDRSGAAPVAVITDGYWKRRFGGSPTVVGQSMLVFGAPVTIVGVTGPGFTGTTVGRSADVTLPLGAAPTIRPELAKTLVVGANTLSVLARQRVGMSDSEVRARLAVVWPQIVEIAMPGAEPSRERMAAARLDVMPGGTGWSTLRQRFGPPLLLLMSLVGFVLLIACANVANLLLVRTAARRREISTRLALGASRGRVARQLITENLLLAAGGATLGLMVAWLGGHSVVTVLAMGAAGDFGPSPGPRPDVGSVFLHVTPDASVLLFTMLLAITTVLLFGTLPALRASKSVMRLSHDIGARVTPRGRTSGVLVTAQLALSLLLLICSGLFVGTLQNLREIDRGFDPKGVLLTEIDGRAAGYTGPALTVLYEDLHQLSERLPGVRAASYSGRTPLAMGETSFGFRIDGELLTEESIFHTIGPRYFETMRTPMVAGREFSKADSSAAPKVSVVNEAFVRRHLRGQNPLGQRVSIEGVDGPPLQIVGVVKDASFSGSVRHFVVPPSVYVPYAQSPPSRVTFAVAVAGSLPMVVASLKRELSIRVPNMRIDVRTMGEQLDRSLLQERLLAGFGGTFGGLALVLAAVGFYGLLAYNVTQRRVEIGLRTALGANRADIVGLVIRDAMRTLATGIALGIPLAFIASSMFSRMLFGLTATDPFTTARAVAVLTLAGVVAAYVPARRAARVDPLVALRHIP